MKLGMDSPTKPMISTSVKWWRLPPMRTCAHVALTSQVDNNTMSTTTVNIEHTLISNW